MSTPLRPDEPLADSPDATQPAGPTATPRHAHAEGDVLAGRYRLLGLLGQGGMGTVWRAHSLALDIDVAVKLVRCEVTNVEANEWLLREARAAASLVHPSIVRIFDFGVTEADEPFIVMELVGGESLADWLDRSSRLSPEQAVQILLPIASALADAHAKGVVHRDIKPENILVVPGVDDTQVPKLVDFGVAKLAGARHGRMPTGAGILVGTPEYMSPEQAQGLLTIDGQTDVWALSVVLYELIAGRRPFEGVHAGAVLLSVVRETPTPTTALGAGDDELWAIIESGLQKAPEARCQGMQELGRALATWAIARGIETDSTGISLSRQWLRSASRPTPDPARESSGSDPSPPPRVRPISDALDQEAALAAATLKSVGAPASSPIVPRFGRRSRLVALASAAGLFGLAAFSLGAHDGFSSQASMPTLASSFAPIVERARTIEARAEHAKLDVDPATPTAASAPAPPTKASASAPKSAAPAVAPARAPTARLAGMPMPLPDKPDF